MEKNMILENSKTQKSYDNYLARNHWFTPGTNVPKDNLVDSKALDVKLILLDSFANG